MPPPAKRQRTSSNGASATDPHTLSRSQIEDLVVSLDSKTATDILVIAARSHSDIAALVKSEVEYLADIERNKVIDFDYLSKSAWKTLNVTYERLSGSHAYDLSGEASNEIEDCFTTIEDQCPASASFKTKENALETLRKIG